MKWFSGLIFLSMVAASLVSCSHKAPATRQDRDKWDQSALKGTYDTVGSRNSKWDKDAEDALTAYAQSRTAPDDEAEMISETIGDSAENAVNEGCNDPIIHYLDTRYSPDVRGKPLKDRQNLYLEAANGLQGSAYPAIWKFYANADAANVLWLNRNDALWQQVVQLRQAAMSDLAQAVQEKSLPEAEAYDAANDLFQMLQYNVGEMTNAYVEVESGIANQPDKAVVA
ncbi:MAG TPA: hypothetical protein VMH87_11130, partial [Pseudomonadales bacterium]|nr:hypothetical protein [Pseudomonadales bacterium]